MEDTVFSKIIRRELPAEILYEDDLVIAVLDRFPTAEGQALVIAKQPVDYLFDVDDATYGRMMSVTRMLARALDAAFDTLRTCVVIEGFSVPHAHVRLYPLKEERTDFSGLGPIATDEALAALGEKIRPNLASI